MKFITSTLLVLLLATTTVSAQQYERYKHLADTTLVSKHLGTSKGISVTVPIEWQRGIDKDFPLVVIFDRQNSRSHDYIIRTIDYLTSNEQMPSCVIVSVESTQEHRLWETLHKASDARGILAENERFVFEELIPLAERSYLASKFRLMIGHSRYGYFTTSLLRSKTDEINAIISLSPFFAQKNVNLVDSVKAVMAQTLEHSIIYRYGIGNEFPDDFETMDAALKNNTNPRFDAKGTLFREADHNATPGLIVGGALYDVFEGWSEIQARYWSNDQQDLGVIGELEREIMVTYGESIPFALGILNGKGWHFYNLGQFGEAAKAWELLVERYPNFSEAYLYIIDAKNILKQDATAEKAQFLKSIAESDLYTAEDKRALMAEFELMK
jgi:hypothetical protein